LAKQHHWDTHPFLMVIHARVVVAFLAIWTLFIADDHRSWHHDADKKERSESQCWDRQSRM